MLLALNLSSISWEICSVTSGYPVLRTLSTDAKYEAKIEGPKMNNGTRRAMTGSIHRIREFELEKVCLVEEFDILQIVGEGWFGKILLVEHRATDTEMVLKALPKPYVPIRDFYREFHYGLHLSAHKNIVTTYDVAFETAGFYVFAQEYAPLGDLTSNMFDTGIGEIHTKRVAKQLAAALEHLHQRELVHRDVKLDNVLIFKSDFSRIKICDFGETRKVQSVVRRRNEWLPYSPPEILKTSVDNSYRALIVHDIWQFGIVIFICLTGCLPWQKAAMDDPRYHSYYQWYNSSNPLKKPPKLFKMVSSKAQKMFKKFIEPRADKRPANFNELPRYLDDRWMAKGYTDRVAGSDIDELCPSMYSFHSDVNEKNILLKHFLDHGIETTVDRQAKKQRIRDWIQNSVITEENEEEDESLANSTVDHESDEELEERSRLHPIEERPLKSTMRFATEKHINPRTGEIIEGVKQSENEVQLSYDVQNIEPVAQVNVLRRNPVKDENISQSSNKDSAYGSLDLRNTSSQSTSKRYERRQTAAISSNSANNSPARSLSNSSINQNRSPIPKPNVDIQSYRNPANARSESSYQSDQNSPLELNRSTSVLQGSTSTLQSLSSIARDNPRPSPSHLSRSPCKEMKHNYVSLKDTAYDVVNNTTDNKEDTNESTAEENPYTSMLNIVQGQIQFSPTGKNMTKGNIVNVTITPLKEVKNKM